MARKEAGPILGYLVLPAARTASSAQGTVRTTFWESLAGPVGNLDTPPQRPAMKSCFGLLLTMLILIAVIGTGATIWYLSNTSEFTKKEAPARP